MPTPLALQLMCFHTLPASLSKYGGLPGLLSDRGLSLWVNSYLKCWMQEIFVFILSLNFVLVKQMISELFQKRTEIPKSWERMVRGTFLFLKLVQMFCSCAAFNILLMFSSLHRGCSVPYNTHVKCHFFPLMWCQIICGEQRKKKKGMHNILHLGSEMHLQT